jgi:[1-hydroxy-2-(trimethylamino)ethyl]phosphonate dioxygenase
VTVVLGGVDDVLFLYARRGDEHYGEDVTQRAHALQCAALARASGADDTLVVAALLHDVGHLLALPRAEGFRDDVDDDDHEAIGARALAPLFGPAVAAPVALHVTAKRWRCFAEPSYLDALSDASRRSLHAQGGPLEATEARRFEQHPSFAAAVALRGWDDAAKDPDVAGEHFDAYGELLGDLAARPR